MSLFPHLSVLEMKTESGSQSAVALSPAHAWTPGKPAPTYDKLAEAHLEGLSEQKHPTHHVLTDFHPTEDFHNANRSVFP